MTTTAVFPFGTNAAMTTDRLPFNLLQWRKFRGLTQEELAARIGSENKSHISKLERRIAPFNERLLYRLADALDCSPIELLLVDPFAKDSILHSALRVPAALRPAARRVIDALAEKDPPDFEPEPAPRKNG